MALTNWLRSLNGARKAAARKSRPARGPLCLETLEDRALPSGGAGPSSLLSGSSSGGSGSSPGGPTPAVLSTGGTGQIVVVTSTSGGGGGGPGGGPGYPLLPTGGPAMTGSGGTSGPGPSVPMPLPDSTVAVVPVLLTTSGGPTTPTAP